MKPTDNVTTTDGSPPRRLLFFHPAFAPYRVDQFNALGELFNLEVVFLVDRIWNFNIDHQSLLKECHFGYSFLLRGIRCKGRLFRFGMLRKIRSFRPDIIIGYEYSFTTQYLILLKRLRLIHQKVGSMVDDSPDICLHVQSRLRRATRERTVRQLDFLVVMSQEVAQFYRNRYQLREQQLIISPILQKPDRLRRESGRIESFARDYLSRYALHGKRVILFVGRFIPEKGLALFLCNIAPLLLRRKDIRLVLVGEGEQLPALQHLVKEYRLEGKVLFPGKYQAEELYGWYVAASGFVLPSLSETFGAVMNEALIFGLPVFCSCYAGASCLINRKNGMLFDPLRGSEVKAIFQLFIDYLTPVTAITLDQRPPLVSEQNEQFNQEWRKIV